MFRHHGATRIYCELDAASIARIDEEDCPIFGAIIEDSRAPEQQKCAFSGANTLPKTPGQRNNSRH
jgi:hypothetical protein